MSEVEEPKFCSECGLSLMALDTWCTSRECQKCGKEVFFVQRGEDGGIKVEKGDKFHIPQITLSIDPSSGGQFTRYGLEGFVKQMFLGQKPIDENELIENYKELEKAIDSELNGLDCISHCDLETESGVKEAREILESEGMDDYRFNLDRSCFLRETYTAIESGNALRAAYSAHMAGLFKEFSLLENHHLKEIIWLGYSCYLDLSKNENLTEKVAKEKRLLNGAVLKIKSFETELLSVFVKDGKPISPRLGLAGIDESTLKALIEHEVDKREKDQEASLRAEELKLKRLDSKIKLWGFLFTLANGLILILYKNWLG